MVDTDFFPKPSRCVITTLDYTTNPTRKNGLQEVFTNIHAKIWSYTTNLKKLPKWFGSCWEELLNQSGRTSKPWNSEAILKLRGISGVAMSKQDSAKQTNSFPGTLRRLKNTWHRLIDFHQFSGLMCENLFTCRDDYKLLDESWVGSNDAVYEVGLAWTHEARVPVLSLLGAWSYFGIWAILNYISRTWYLKLTYSLKKLDVTTWS